MAGSVARMDIGAFVLTTLDSDVHTTVARVTRSYLAEIGSDPARASLLYAVDPLVPAIALCVLDREDADVYVWHLENGALGARLARELGVEAWSIISERRTGYTEGRRFDARGRCKYEAGEESDRVIRACARRIKGDRKALAELLTFFGPTLSQPLSEADDPELLQEAIAKAKAKAPAPKPAKPRKKRTPRAPKIAPVTVMRPDGYTGDDEQLFKPPTAWSETIDRRRFGWFSEPELEPSAAVAAKEIQQAKSKLSVYGTWLVFDLMPEGHCGYRSKEMIEAVASRFEGNIEAVGSAQVEGAAASALRPVGDLESAEAAFVDLWVATRGLAFAVECVLDAQNFAYAFQPAGQSGRAYGQPVYGASSNLARALRRHLAAASEVAYTAARQGCAERLETRSVQALALRSYLFPDEPEWFEAVAAEGDWLGLAEANRPTVPPLNIFCGLEHLPAWVESFGLDLVPFLDAQLKNRHFAVSRDPLYSAQCRSLGEALASIPSDDAMRVLHRWKGKPSLARYLATAVSNYPERAARVGVV